MTDNIVHWGGVTKLDINPDRILQAAIERGLEEVVILGYTKDEQEYFAASRADVASTLWHLERAKHKLMCMADD